MWRGVVQLKEESVYLTWSSYYYREYPPPLSETPSFPPSLLCMAGSLATVYCMYVQFCSR